MARWMARDGYFGSLLELDRLIRRLMKHAGLASFFRHEDGEEDDDDDDDDDEGLAYGEENNQGRASETTTEENLSSRGTGLGPRDGAPSPAMSIPNGTCSRQKRGRSRTPRRARRVSVQRARHRSDARVRLEKRLFRHESLRSAAREKASTKKKKKLEQVELNKSPMTLVGESQESPVVAINQAWREETAPPKWETIVPSDVHSCVHCQTLRIHAGTTVSRGPPPRQRRLLRYAQIAEAASDGCIVFSWLLDMVSQEVSPENRDERYFDLSVMPGGLSAESSIGLESNDHEEFDFESHGSLGAYVLEEDNNRPSEFTRGLPLNVDVASEENFKATRGWIAECLERHLVCRASNPSKLPSRVLKISRKTQRVRLVETHRESDAKYAALSYCWGSSTQPVITTTESLQDWKTDIPVQRLPQTIRDAIFTTHRLGLKYLWVDSLCIVQDSPSDQRAEIPLMSDIYHGAYVTISAACAGSYAQGFLHRRTPSIAAVPLVYPDGSYGALHLYQELRASQEPIHQRAWPLQEHVQSRRILEYGTQQLRRICRGGGEPDNDEVLLKHYNPATNDKSTGTVPAAAQETVRNHWRRLVQDFTTRGIRHHTDRPLAIQGIAIEYEKAMGVACVAGLWGERFLPRELLWGREPSRRPLARPRNPTTLPSWSWFSVDATIIWTDWPDDYRHADFGVLQCDADRDLGYSDDARHGARLLKVKGPRRKATWDARRCFLRDPDGQTGDPIAETTADAVVEEEDEGEMLVETVEVLSIPSQAAVGLVLAGDAVGGYYKRLGLFWTPDVCEGGDVGEWLSKYNDDVFWIS